MQEAAGELQNQAYLTILLDQDAEPFICPQQAKTAAYLLEDGLPNLPLEVKESIIQFGFERDFLAARNKLRAPKLDMCHVLNERAENREKSKIARAKAIAEERAFKEKMEIRERYVQAVKSFCGVYRSGVHIRSKTSRLFVSTLEVLLENNGLDVLQKAASAEKLIRDYFEKEHNNNRSRSITLLKKLNLAPTDLSAIVSQIAMARAPTPIFYLGCIAISLPVPEVQSESPKATTQSGLLSQVGLYRANFPPVPTAVPVVTAEVEQPRRGKQA